jgi:hypothetical protein
MLDKFLDAVDDYGPGLAVAGLLILLALALSVGA